MTIKQFINENKIQIFILAILFLIIFFYLYNKNKKEYMGNGMKTGGSILIAISGAILPCICWCLIMYFISKKAASAAIRESSSNRNSSNRNSSNRNSSNRNSSE